jgi:hypothetical protein
MAFKIGVAVGNAGWRQGRNAALALLASEIVLAATMAWGIVAHLS